MRGVLNKILLTVVAGLLIVTTNAQDKVIDQVVAVVGANIILKSDVENTYFDNQAQGVTSTGDMRCNILEDLLVNKLLIAEAEIDTTIEVTPSDINQRMEGTLQMYIDHLGSEKAVEDYFKEPIAQVKADLQERVRDGILVQQMEDKIMKDVNTTPSEVRAYYRSLKSNEIPDIPTEYEYKQITVAPRITLEEENRIKAQLRDIKKKIMDGTSFDAMAIYWSEGPEAKNGGKLEYMGRADMDPDYAAAAFSLKINQISNVVKTDNGYHIIKLLDRKGEKIKTQDIMMRPRISPEAMEETSTKLDSLANLIRKNELTFDNAAMMYSSDKATRNNGGLVINPNTMSSRFSVEELDADVSKVLTTLRLNEISDPFKTVDANGQTIYKIVKLVNKIPGHKANLQSDYQQLAEAFLNKKKEKTLREWIEKQQKDTYIRIDPTYANCNFKFTGWIK